jgi:hypothetical protein
MGVLPPELITPGVPGSLTARGGNNTKYLTNQVLVQTNLASLAYATVGKAGNVHVKSAHVCAEKINPLHQQI